MLTYYNAGPAGREYSRLTVERASIREIPVTVQIVDKDGESRSVLLDTAQIAHLIESLKPFAGVAHPLIEGSLF